MYPERDLNPHDRSPRILSPVCLPIPSSGRCDGEGKMEASAGFEPAIELLQSPALGHLATTPDGIKDYRDGPAVNRKTAGGLD